jgi:hypothetical protein
VRVCNARWPNRFLDTENHPHPALSRQRERGQNCVRKPQFTTFLGNTKGVTVDKPLTEDLFLA